MMRGLFDFAPKPNKHIIISTKDLIRQLLNQRYALNLKCLTTNCS